MARVLCVDDNVELIEVLMEMLRTSGHEPYRALGGEECLELLKNGKCTPDIIMLDLMMHPMDGWSVLKAIREDDRFDAIPVIILTGKYPTMAEVVEYCTMFEGYLMKPFAIDRLMEEIEGVLQKVRTREEVIRRASQKGMDQSMLDEYRKLSSTAIVLSQFETIITDGTFTRKVFSGMEKRLDNIEDWLTQLGVLVH
ncbi:MAG: response regulator [Methanomassiliicoccales archaeon]|nr:response regulator [Methanomassiliicoccales archaeon]